jgi:hypothetical protein
MDMTRRETLAAAAGASAGMWALGTDALASGHGSAGGRRFHYSVDGALIDAEPELLTGVRQAGVTDIWLGWFVGPEPPSDSTIEQYRGWMRRIEAAGMAAHLITIPLGHPAPGPSSPTFPVEGHWGVRPDGRTYGGNAFHPPLLRENLISTKRFKSLPFRRLFVDDDFRLAPAPFDIGGCFCPQHRAGFLARYGYPESRWPELIEAVRNRTDSAVMQAWVKFTCDELTGVFRQLSRAAAPEAVLGIMVMFIGCEKAGIRLPDYRNVPMRVGEMMFDDAGFGTPKGKTDELFSVLFHRRFVHPEMAFSETTAYPPERLSPKNGAAKLCTSTIADVRNTMLMCMNLADWSRREPGMMAAAMKKQAALHRRLAGHRPAGPFKHYWGEPSRRVGGDWPYSLFLATGVPFEVTERPAADGWTFLSDADARALAEGKLKSPGTTFIFRPTAARTAEGRAVADTLPDLFALRRELLPRLGAVPYVEQEQPVVCAWYPAAHAALLWNLQEIPVDLTLRAGSHRREVHIAPLDLEIVEDVPAGPE